MLNLERFQNNYNVTIQGGIATINLLTENGQIDGCCCKRMDWFNGSFYVDINNIKNIRRLILKHINDKNGTSFKESDLSIIDNRVCWNQIEDEDDNILETKEEIDEAILEDDAYLVDYYVFIYINGLELKGEELRGIFPKAN